MKLKIDPQIFAKFPDLKLGVIVLKNINNSRRNSAVESLLRGISAKRGKEFAEKDLISEPKIRVWYDAYGNFGINPKKNPPGVAALLKRVGSGKEIPHLSTLVNLYNYFSLKYLLPIGGEDLDWLCGDLNLTFTKGGEAFRPIGEIDVKEAGEGEIAYMDHAGITCRYWNHRECERTKFTEKTVNAAIIMEDLSHMHLDEFGAILGEMEEAFRKYIGGDIEVYVLNEDNPGIEFGIQGRKTADDSKVPKQEQAHFLSLKKTKKKAKSVKSKMPELPFPKEGGSKLKMEDENLLISKVKKLLEIALMKAFPEHSNGEITLEYPAQKKYGDYSANIAMHLTKILQMPPREIAEKIINSLPENDLIEKAEIAGPGFINLFISDDTYFSLVDTILKDKEKYGQSEIGKNKNLIVEYSAPNIAKPLGVHHLLSTVIGQSLYNLFKFLGFDAVSINHIGDWGTQFGKLICAYKKWGDKKTVEKDPINEMLKLYVNFHNEAEKTPELEDEAREEFRKFEEGDKENHKLWQWFKDESLKEIEKTYAHLGGIHFDHTQGESFYEDKTSDLLKEGKQKGIFVVGEEGSYIVEYDDENMPPFVVQKKDGATLYSTRDFAALKYRIDTWHPVRILYVVDVAQSLHFKELFAAAERFPWYHGEAVHVNFGRMRMKEGKMSTRKGNVILLDEVLSEAEKLAKKVIEKKNPNLRDRESVAKSVGIGAVKYNILSQNRTTDITFDWDKMLSLEGNSAPYLQYTYARGRSILRKANIEETSGNNFPDPVDSKERTRNLIMLFARFPEQLAEMALDYRPNILCNYLYELAQEFNSFYNSVPVLKAENSETREKRLKIVEAASQIMKNGLGILGIEPLEEM